MLDCCKILALIYPFLYKVSTFTFTLLLYSGDAHRVNLLYFKFVNDADFNEFKSKIIRTYDVNVDGKISMSEVRNSLLYLTFLLVLIASANSIRWEEAQEKYQSLLSLTNQISTSLLYYLSVLLPFTLALFSFSFRACYWGAISKIFSTRGYHSYSCFS